MTRFDLDMDGSMEPSEHGRWVRYEDAQRTWVGLTDEDKAEIKKQANYNWETTTGEYASKVQALTEAKLKAKNSL